MDSEVRSMAIVPIKSRSTYPEEGVSSSYDTPSKVLSNRVIPVFF
jgi:hypothetical protein